MTKQKCMHCYISGKVQGVWYRASTKDKADELGITGFARNLPDGRVEVMATGDEKQLRLLHEWLRRGPDLANVTDVTYEELPWQDYQRFDVL